MKRERRKCAMVAILMMIAATAVSADWPMWKCNSSRTAVTPDALSTELHLQWSRQLPRARQAWRDKSNFMLFFDASYEPVVMGSFSG